MLTTADAAISASTAHTESARFLKECWSLQAVAYMVVGLRYFSRIRQLGWGKLAMDDGLMFLALLVYTAETVMAHLVVAWWHGLANNAMTDEQRRLLDPDSKEYRLRVNGSKTHVAGLLLYTTLLWLLKGCWTVYYGRLTAGVYHMRRWVVGAYIAMPATYVACLCVAFFKCVPFDRQWQIYPDPGNNCEPAVSVLQTVFVMVMNTMTDLCLLAIPLPIVWQSSLPWYKKLFLMVMFSGGFMEMAFGIVRCVSILTANSDPAQSGYWSVRESFVSVVLTNMPMVYPLLKRFLEQSIISLSGGRTDSDEVKNKSGVPGNGYPLSSNPGNSNAANRRTLMNRHPLSVPDSIWGSEENIVRSEDGRALGSETSNHDGDIAMQTHVRVSGHGGTTSVEKTPIIEPQNSGGSGRMGRQQGIIVTHEITVTEDRMEGPSTMRW
ncbi:hypothetical protein QBC32DRAFT_270442 [Pseudoneurospora amorphoporcata]|uniref:Rhodopsin domain-containing protein n=1 Tax=Pseudoneurospora amorphoporcata TaxID=241081 RepID=A0AAN6NM40_9PEZI|nr:hypothetical protein QBC32DRAFT_270442 [Pseudoneurospora amorphoporcata]